MAKVGEPEIRDNKVVFNKAFDIHFSQAVPHFNSEPNKAYVVDVKGEKPGGAFALVCEPYLLHQRQYAGNYSRISHPAVMRLLSHGVVYWPPARAERYVYIYENNEAGQPFVQGHDNIALGMDVSDVRNRIVLSLINAMKNFSDRQLVHGNIRLDNIYKREYDGQLADVVVGDGLSLPHGYGLPAVFRTIPAGLAAPDCIGLSGYEDDIYALGVCIAMMIRKTDPLAGMSEVDIVRAKMQQGSYAALMGKLHLTGPMLEVLRGTLHDDVSTRWTIEDLLSWADGRRLSPKQNIKSKSAQRPIEFNGDKYWQLDVLSADLMNNVTEAYHLYESGDLFQWIDNSLNEKKISQQCLTRLESAQKGARDQRYNDRIVSYMAMSFYPNFPIQFRDVRLFPSGLGVKLMKALSLGEDVNLCVEMIHNGLISSWLTFQEGEKRDNVITYPMIESCRKVIRDTKIGFGVERCFYAFAPWAPCLSPVLKGKLVYDSSHLLIALEDLCARGAVRSHLIFDRHIAAFLADREPRVMDNLLFDLASHQPAKAALSTLAAYSGLQKQCKSGPLTALAAALVPMIKPVIDFYKDREKRETLRKKIDHYVQQGDLDGMYRELTNPHALRMDQQLFKEALLEYNNISVEQSILRESMTDKSKFNDQTGREISTLIIGGIAAMVILLMLFVTISSSDGAIPF